MPRRSFSPMVPNLRRFAVMGNVNVGKTTIFRYLVQNREHEVRCPGSERPLTRGVLATGPDAASQRFKQGCAACGGAASGWGRRRRGTPCRDAVEGNARCPALRTRDGAAPSQDLAQVPAPPPPRVVHLYDTPGASTLVGVGEDEILARDLLLSGVLDGVVLVADANNLRRSLALALELSEFQLPMVFVVNMADEAQNLGTEVNEAALSALLGVDVCLTIAVEGVGLRRVAERIAHARVPKARAAFPDAIEQALAQFDSSLHNPLVSGRGIGCLLLAGDAGVATWISHQLGDAPLKAAEHTAAQARAAYSSALGTLLADSFHLDAQRIAEQTTSARRFSLAPLERFGRLAQRPFPGLIFAAVLLMVAYLWVGLFGATWLVDWLATHVFQAALIPWADRAVAFIPSAFVRDAIMDPDLGLLPTGLFLALGLVLPVLFCFYLFQAVLEDSGYLPRLSILFDRVFRRLGLNGQALIPLVLGFSCVTMAVITTRMLPSRKERIILTLLLVLGVPCAPLLAVFLVILAEMSWTATATVMGIIILQMLAASMLAARFLPGALPDLILEIPRMRIPRPAVLLDKTWRRSWQFMREAVPIFLAASFTVFLFNRFGGLKLVANAAHPVVHGLLGLPDEALQVFIKTLIRRENGATELNLLRDRFDNVQLVVTMLVMTFFMPCLNATIVIIKERGIKVAAAILTSVAIWALVVGALVGRACLLLGVHF